MKWLITRLKNNSGLTLVEVLISVLILSFIAACGTYAFVFAVQKSRDNEYEMVATNLANDRIEYIRSLKFAEVGTKTVVGGHVIYGDPKGDILQTEIKTVGGVKYTINTTISWEDQSGWDLGSVDWDYKSIKVEVIPELPGDTSSYAKTFETMVTRDSMQPIIMEGNISLRVKRGWSEDATLVTVPDVKVNLSAGPDAPRQIKTSSAGIARFLNLRAGNYTVNLEPSVIGMMQQPNQAVDWITSVAQGITRAQEFEVEYPCHIKLTLKDLDGDPIYLSTGESGTIKVEVPYGTDINKSFNSSNINPQGIITADFLGGLWPVGAGYAGVYSISDIQIPDSTYLGAYEGTPHSEVLWSGTFSAPGTVKEITCYFGVTPDTPGGIDENWVESTQYIKENGPYTAGIAEFASYNLSNSISTRSNSSSEFNAYQMYFENTGSSNSGLRIRNRSRLTLNSGLIVFRGGIEIMSATDPSNAGSIVLNTVFSDGTEVPSIPGSDLGDTAHEDKNYGKLYLVKPLVQNGVTLVEPGGYYFYDGQTLPGNASELIPITKENYVD